MRTAGGQLQYRVGSKRLFRCHFSAFTGTDAWRTGEQETVGAWNSPTAKSPAMARHEAVRRDLCSGTVTFLFSDEGSTKLLHKLGVAAYAEATAEHREILRRVFSAHGGVEVDTQGDAFFVTSQRTGRCA